MNHQRITFPSGSLTLEGLIAGPDGFKGMRGGVVCHPHPLYGGSMYNNVVDAILDAMWRQGWATLRFNFRGVGESEGEFGGGAGEAEDAAAALAFLQAQLGVKSEGAVLAGYSFGSVAAMTAATTIATPGALVLVALPLKMADTSAITKFGGPIVLAAGDRDLYCPAQQLEALREQLGERAQISIVQGADHFFRGCEPELADALAAMFAKI
jgi:uncharacterized protein